MAGPFSPDVATKLIKENPGRSALDIVRDAIDRGIITSRSYNGTIGQTERLTRCILITASLR